MGQAESPTGRPTATGWYWVRTSDDSPWQVTHVIATRGQLCAIDPHLDIAHPIALVDPFWDDVRWHGPIMPEDLDDRRRLDFLSAHVVRLQSNTLPGKVISSYDVNVWPGDEDIVDWPIRGWGHGRTLREAIDAAIANMARNEQDDD